MANSYLYNKTYKIPQNIIADIQSTLVSNPNANGIKRAKFLVKNGELTYSAIKRLKNFFDTFNYNNGDEVQYALAGGDSMKIFVDGKLNSERSGVDMEKKIKQDVNIDVNLGTHAYRTSSELNESENSLKQNSIAIIVNGDNKILLLKRSDDVNQWMPSKWALVGGGIETDETPIEACKREVFEETGLSIDKFIGTFAIKRNKNSVEHIFACRYLGEPTNIKLNGENSTYGWFDITEMAFLDIVPNLIEYITLAFKEYE